MAFVPEPLDARCVNSSSAGLLVAPNMQQELERLVDRHRSLARRAAANGNA